MARTVNDVCGNRIAREDTVRFGFQRIRSGNFDLQNVLCRRSKTQADKGFEGYCDVDSSQNMSELQVAMLVIKLF